MSDFRHPIQMSVLAVFLNSCNPQIPTDDYHAHMVDVRRKKNKEMLESGSPLEESAKRGFAGLDYFAPDTSFRIKARFIQYGMVRSATIETNTDRRPVYEEIGEFIFIISGVKDTLRAYRIPGDTNLFVPFNDPTNGHTTYPTGRYLDLPIPDNEQAVLDFNLAYNPYCAYNSRYSCPIPPPANKIQVPVQAGERKFHK